MLVVVYRAWDVGCEVIAIWEGGGYLSAFQEDGLAGIGVDGCYCSGRTVGFVGEPNDFAGGDAVILAVCEDDCVGEGGGEEEGKGGEWERRTCPSIRGHR